MFVTSSWSIKSSRFAGHAATGAREFLVGNVKEVGEGCKIWYWVSEV